MSTSTLRITYRIGTRFGTNLVNNVARPPPLSGELPTVSPTKILVCSAGSKGRLEGECDYESTMEMVQCFRVTRYGPTLCARQMYFAFGASSHQVLDSIMRRFALVQDRVHLLGYRHLDFVLAGKLQGGVGRVNAFCDHAVHAGDDLRQSAPAPEF